MCSLPIEFAPGARKRYCEIGAGGGPEVPDMGTMVEHLTLLKKDKVRPDAWAHLDPDLDPLAIPRLPGWRAGFGQSEIAQVHLSNEGVGEGDVFLFHGWFREVLRDGSGRWQYRRGAPDINVIFGWMQVGEVIDLERTTPGATLQQYPWLEDHPHLNLPKDLRLSPPAHAIYIAAPRFHLPGISVGIMPGAGVFRRMDERLILTAKGASGRSTWRLPVFFKGGNGVPYLTQFPRSEWWTDVDDGVVLRPVGRQGQEAVLDCRQRPDAAAWIASLLACAAGSV